MGSNEIETSQLQKSLALWRIKIGFQNEFTTYLRWYTVEKLKSFGVALLSGIYIGNISWERLLAMHKFLMVTGVLGLIVGILKAGSMKRDKLYPMVFLVALPVYFTGIHLVYHAYSRYVLPVVPMVFISAGVVDLLNNFRRAQMPEKN